MKGPNRQNQVKAWKPKKLSTVKDLRVKHSTPTPLAPTPQTSTMPPRNPFAQRLRF